MKQLGNILLVIGGGMLCLVLATSLVRFGVAITSVRTKLWIFGGTSVLLGGLFARIYNERSLRLLGYRVVDRYKAIAILALNALVFYVGLELAASKIRGRISSPAQDSRAKVSYYSSQDWAEQYWYEHQLSVNQRYYPYVGWRRAPFKGETIEIDQNGIRLTPGADCSATSFKVFTFGSSEMWGTGSPNWGTIPANLQKGLEKLRQGPVCVVNFAESAYVSTQDVIMLLVQLRSGNVPDLVLFFSIGGDIYSAYQSGRAGTLQNLDQVAAKFEKGSPYIDHLRKTHSYALIDEFMRKLTIAEPKQKEATPIKPITYESMGVDVAKLSDLIVQDYFGNYEIVNALAQKYSFKYFFFLPPKLLMGNKPLTSEEQEMKRETESNVALSKLYKAVYQTIERESSKYQNLSSMVDIFDRYDSLLWIDSVHVTPIGNRLIAARMLDVIQARSSDEKRSTISD